MMNVGLRARFLLSGAALVLTTVASGAWSAHAFARLGDVARDLAATRGRPVSIVLGLSGRGDKDLSTLLARLVPASGGAS